MARAKTKTDELLKSSRQALTPHESLFWEHSSPGSMRTLLRAGLECFAEQGFHGTSTRDIAKRAGMSPAAVYVHFKSKEELLFHIAVVMARAGYENLAKVAERPGTNSQHLHAMAHAHAKFHAEMSTAARVTNFEHHALTTQKKKSVLAYYAKTEDLFRNCLRDGKAAGEFRLKDLTVTTSAVMSLILAVCRWYQPGGRLSPEDVGTIYGDLVLAMARLDGSFPSN